MSLGVPILSSNCKYGPSEILLDKNNKEYGKLVELTEDIDGYINNLTTAIIKLYENPKLRNTYKKSSLERVALFDIDNVIGSYLKLFKIGR